ncbi:MAG: restriction endonuclease subunit S, partial [Oscillibacter sp.]|nr:restriction endonuclease subunit S [Oscillibacter sp.]
SGELTANWRAEHGHSKEQWTTRALRDCGAWSGGGTPSMKHPEYWQAGDILWITPKDMKANLIEDSIMRINMEGVGNSSANYIEKHSVLFVMRSGILRHTLPIAMVEQPFTVNQDLKALSPSDIDLHYLFWACKCREKDILENCAKNGTTVESMNSKALMGYELPIAPAEEQAVIVRYVESMMEQEQEAKAAAERVLTSVGLMKEAILARAFRGLLGTNDPAEPCAEI